MFRLIAVHCGDEMCTSPSVELAVNSRPLTSDVGLEPIGRYEDFL